VIDDERVVRDLVTEMLTAEGLTVDVQDNGRTGVEHYQRHWPEIDLVILDLVMPEIHGSEVFRWLKRINPAARILVASGYTADGEAESLLTRGAIGFIQKPFDRELLMRLVNEALAGP
jgi:DNA-binding NtrC family response regulator